jgi:D-aminoacyl-tRNA deacylase
MRVVIQRVTEAKVEVDGRVVGAIGPGLVVFLSVTHADTADDAQFIAEKLVNLRIFSDEAGKMNLSVQDVGGKILMISQFTLHGDCRKGRRPGFDQAAPPEQAQTLYNHTIDLVRQQGITVETGVFAAHMHVSSLNDGPVTFMLDSSRLF